MKNLFFLKKFLIHNELDKAIGTAMSIEGQISREEARVLYNLAEKVQQKNVIVEIESYQGRSTVILALGSKLGGKNRVYSIDPHLDFHDIRGAFFTSKDMSALYSNLTKSSVGDTVGVITLKSQKAAGAWEERNIGLLWIDGDHRYTSVRADFEAWSVFVVKGGIIAFHDIDLPDINLLINELVKSKQLEQIGEIGAMSWFKKI